MTQAGNNTGRQARRHGHRQTDRDTGRQTRTQAGRQGHRQVGRETGRLTDSQRRHHVV